MELRERVAKAIGHQRAIRMVEANGGDPSRIKAWTIDAHDRQDADAAIAAVLDALQEPSIQMCEAGVDNLFGAANEDWAVDAKEVWQAMLAAFRTEALGEG